MSERILTPRLAFSSLLALAFSASVMAQTAPAPKADAAKAPVKPAAATENDPDVALAKKAALDWLALSDAGKFDATWDEAATMFQKAQNKGAWAKGLGDARPTMGKLINRSFLNSEIRTSLPGVPPGKYITVRFNSVFEKHKDGAESVTLIKDGTRGFRMMSYFLK